MFVCSNCRNSYFHCNFLSKLFRSQHGAAESTYREDERVALYLMSLVNPHYVKLVEGP